MKIHIFGYPNELHFIRPMMDYWQEKGHEVSTSSDAGSISDAAKGAKLVICEWAGALAREVSFALQKEAGQLLIVRCHYDEAFNGKVEQINWANVDYCWFVSEYVKKHFLSRFPEVKTFIVPTILDDRQFPFIYKKYDKTLCMVSLNLDPRKGHEKAIWLLKKLTDIDSGYTLIIRALLAPPERLDELTELAKDLGVTGNVQFVNNSLDVSKLVMKGDLISFYKDKDIILSCSKGEGTQVAFGEAVISGLFPICFAWPGAEEVYPGMCFDSDEKMIGSILNFNKLNNNERTSHCLNLAKCLLNRYGYNSVNRKFESFLLNREGIIL